MTAPEDQDWDVIVIGTGMGGATLGHALAKAGRRVLFCEQGRSTLGESEALRGAYAETFFPAPTPPQTRHSEILARAGRSQQSVEDISAPRPRRFIPFIGAGIGGSTALYGMAMERLFPADFSPRDFHADPTSSLPAQWPIDYPTLRPYYEAAERLYRVRGGVDVLREGERPAYLAPPALSAGSASLWSDLAAQGLHPYRLPMACEYLPSCAGCQGYLCPRPCKNDSARTCLEPALRDHGAVLLSECRVLKLEASRDEVSGVVCAWRGRMLRLRGRLIVLAAGALATPRLLRASASPLWPRGLANESGLVGRNLMRHFVDLYVLWPEAARGAGGNLKELALNDLYLVDGHKLGSVQSFGALPPVSVLAAGLLDDLGYGPLPWAGRVLQPFAPLLRWLLARKLANSVVLASIMEDLPYPDNQVLETNSVNDTVRISYHISGYDRARIALMRRRMDVILKSRRYLLLKQAENNQQLAHVCGTCRFGTDPQQSVLDENNRAHGLTNLYVVDSSFFPSSGGTNPSLTIAANALRVAVHILRGA